MGTKTFSEFKDDLKFGLGQRDDLASYLGGWVNTAYRTLTTGNRFWQIKRNFRFPELEASDTATTVAGTAYVSTPSGAMVVQRVHDTTNDVKLNKIGWGTYVGYTGRASSTSRGKPSEWARRGDYIYVHPTPDDEYELEVFHRKRPTAMSANSDVTEIGAEWDEPIVQLAVAQSWLRLQNAEKYKLWMDLFKDSVVGLIGIYDHEEIDEKGYIHPDEAYVT